MRRNATVATGSSSRLTPVWPETPRGNGVGLRATLHRARWPVPGYREHRCGVSPASRCMSIVGVDSHRGFWIPACAGMTSGWSLRWTAFGLAAPGRVANAKNHSRPKPAHRHRSGQPAPARQPVVAAQAPIQCGVKRHSVLTPGMRRLRGLDAKRRAGDALRERAWVLDSGLRRNDERVGLAVDGRGAYGADGSAPMEEAESCGSIASRISLVPLLVPTTLRPDRLIRAWPISGKSCSTM